MTKGADRKRIRVKRGRERELRRSQRLRSKRLRSVLYTGAFFLSLAGIGLGLKIAFAPPPPAAPSPPPSISPCTGEKPRPFEREGGPFGAPAADEIDLDHIYVATIKTYCGNLEFKIDPRDAPAAARSFIFLAKKKFYDGLTFDRLVENLGVFGGTADPGYTMAATAGSARARGDLVMIDLGEDSTVRVGSRFAVVTGPNLGLAGARIGSVLDPGRRTFDVLARLFEQPVSGSVPSEPLYILHIEIQEFDRS